MVIVRFWSEVGMMKKDEDEERLRFQKIPNRR